MEHMRQVDNMSEEQRKANREKARAAYKSLIDRVIFAKDRL